MHDKEIVINYSEDIIDISKIVDCLCEALYNLIEHA